MTNKQRLEKLVEAERLLKLTKGGYPGPGKGTYWRTTNPRGEAAAC